MSAAAPPLAPDLTAGLKRLKLARVRAIAPEVLVTARTQRWAPEELLRTLVEAEIAARDQANAAARLRTAGFPMHKGLDEFKVAASSVPQATFDYLAALEWIEAAENVVLVGPAGTGKSHCENEDRFRTRGQSDWRRQRTSMTRSLIGSRGRVRRA